VLPTALDACPDVALLDIEMSGGDGLSAAQLKELLPACRVVIPTTFGRAAHLKRAMESGAVGFLLKDAPAAGLAPAIRRVMARERVVDPVSELVFPRDQELAMRAVFGCLGESGRLLCPLHNPAIRVRSTDGALRLYGGPRNLSPEASNRPYYIKIR